VNEVIFSLRKRDIRVILLAGEGSGELRQAAIGMGVYDIIEDPFQAADVVERVLHPATFAEAVDGKPPNVPGGTERDIFNEEQYAATAETTFAEARAMLESRGAIPSVAGQDGAAGDSDANVSDTGTGRGGRRRPRISLRNAGPPGGGITGTIINAVRGSLSGRRARTTAAESGAHVSRPGAAGTGFDARMESPGVRFGRRKSDRRAAPGDASWDAMPGPGRGAGSGLRGIMQNEKGGRIDFLTGLPRRESIAGMRLSGAHSVLFADLNGFKKVNDRYGHTVGDRILQEFAQVTRCTVRSDDTVVRWGGDEFVVLLAGTDRQGAEDAASRLRSRWAANAIASRYKVGVAVGMKAAYDGAVLDEVVAAADAEMYRDKKKTSAIEPRLFAVGGARMSDGLLRKISNGALVDTDIQNPLIYSFDRGRESWKCDWRQGLRAVPLLLPFGVEFYGVNHELGTGYDERDYEKFEDFLLALLPQKVVMVNMGSDEAIAACLSRLGAVPLKTEV
jgi:diguanylate cyclase (GGDEF)-like protein